MKFGKAVLRLCKATKLGVAMVMVSYQARLNNVGKNRRMHLVDDEKYSPLPPFWERVEVIIKRVKTTHRSDQRIERLLGSATGLMLVLLLLREDYDDETLGRSLLSVYDGINGVVAGAACGTAWLDLGLHLSQFRQ